VKQEAGENYILRSFTNCTPHNIQAIKSRCRWAGAFACGRQTQGVLGLKKRTNETAITAQVKMERHYNGSERNRVGMRRLDQYGSG
jgi:hypothetical protein